MEFKFRAGDQQPPKFPSPRPPVVYCFSKQGFQDACLRRTTNSIVTLRKPFESNDSMHCEMELMRLREEKLLLEIERQRFLKEDARRELMLIEREIAIRGGAQPVSYSVREQHRLGTTAPLPVVQTFHGLQKQQPQQQQQRSSDRLVFGAVVLPPPPRVQPFTAEEKKELIVLEKPDPSVFREKQKAQMPSTSTVGIRPFGVKKNPKDEWSCALCQVTMPSEKTFNDHLHGKKHKRKAAGLMAQKASKGNISQAAPEPLPNVCRKKRKAKSPSTSTVDIQPFGVKKNPKDEWSCKLCQTTASSERMFNEHLHSKKHKSKEAGLMAQKASKSDISQAPLEPLPNKRRKLFGVGVTAMYGSAGAEKKESKVEQCEETEGSFDLNRIIPNFLKLSGKEDKRENVLVIEQNSITEDVFVGKKKFKLWCEKCKVGAYTTDVMFAHLKGKKHQSNLDRNGGTRPPL